MRYLSQEWIAAVAENVAASETLARLADTHDLSVTQVVTGCPDGDVTYHFEVGGGTAVFGPGPAPREQVRLEQSWETSLAVATHSVPAQEVFIKGQVRLTGDVQRLIDNQVVFGALDAAFEGVRERTDYA